MILKTTKVSTRSDINGECSSGLAELSFAQEVESVGTMELPSMVEGVPLFFMYSVSIELAACGWTGPLSIIFEG